jgi:4-hydroxy-tetrahydrodipicolinate synthase
MGLDGVVVAPPFYLPISQEEMREYLEGLVPKLPLPFLIYNMPACTKMHMSVEIIRKAKELGAISVKDSSGDLSYLFSLINEFKSSPEFSILTGTELHLPDTILNGGHGAVAGGANLFPELFVDLYNASLERNFKKIEALREIVKIINKTIYYDGKNITTVIKGLKCALSVMDICDDYLAFPLRRYNREGRRTIEISLEGLKKIMG